MLTDKERRELKNTLEDSAVQLQEIIYNLNQHDYRPEVVKKLRSALSSMEGDAERQHRKLSNA